MSSRVQVINTKIKRNIKQSQRKSVLVRVSAGLELPRIQAIGSQSSVVVHGPSLLSHVSFIFDSNLASGVNEKHFSITFVCHHYHHLYVVTGISHLVLSLRNAKACKHTKNGSPVHGVKIVDCLPFPN